MEWARAVARRPIGPQAPGSPSAAVLVTPTYQVVQLAAVVGARRVCRRLAASRSDDESSASQNTPSPQGTRVASATHNRFGAQAVKLRLTKSGAGVLLGRAAAPAPAQESAMPAPAGHEPLDPCTAHAYAATERDKAGEPVWFGASRLVADPVPAQVAHPVGHRHSDAPWLWPRGRGGAGLGGAAGADVVAGRRRHPESLATVRSS